MLASSFGSVSSSLRRTSANDRSDEILMCSTAMVCDAKVACVLAWVISRSKAPEHAAACTAEQGDEITASHCLPKAQDCATVAPNGAITSRICERVLAAIQFCRGIPGEELDETAGDGGGIPARQVVARTRYRHRVDFWNPLLQ